jgi:NAD(P)-dependent dehydrogenase (short-subunit alcohol dehydrogenase family)
LIDLSAELLEKASPSLHPQSNTILLCIAADCSVEAEVENAVEKTVEKFGRLDFCFNAAGRGVGPNGPGKIEALGSEDFDKVVGLNLRGVWLCERAQIRQMMRQEVRDVR